MIRFKPDSWLDVLMRPLDMVSPEANIYVEIAAPDLRAAAAVLLALAALLAWRRTQGPRRATLGLLLATAIAWAGWLVTSGNGRYFVPMLVLLGPLCIGLLRLLPITAAFRFTLAGLLVALQVFLVTQASPWQAWAWLPWRAAPYFQIDAPPQDAEVTYASISTISYSLIAPQFPPEARWINLASGRATPRDEAAVRAFLAQAKKLVLVAPSLPQQTLANQQPTAEARAALDVLLSDHALSLAPGQACGFLASGGLAAIAGRQGEQAERLPKLGFWLCPLQRGAAPAAPLLQEVIEPRIDRAFEAVEQLCPRFFIPGEATTRRVEGGYARHYGSDTRVYVLEDGRVTYKFWRSLNAVQIGTVQQVLAGQASVDCDKIRASNWRSGGP